MQRHSAAPPGVHSVLSFMYQRWILGRHQSLYRSETMAEDVDSIFQTSKRDITSCYVQIQRIVSSGSYMDAELQQGNSLGRKVQYQWYHSTVTSQQEGCEFDPWALGPFLQCACSSRVSLGSPWALPTSSHSPELQLYFSLVPGGSAFKNISGQIPINAKPVADLCFPCYPRRTLLF